MSTAVLLMSCHGLEAPLEKKAAKIEMLLVFKADYDKNTVAKQIFPARKIQGYVDLQTLRDKYN